MKLTEKTKKTLTAIAAVVFVAVVGAWIIFSGTGHIEDTNGADNYALQTITDENIINMDTGSIGGPMITRGIPSGDTVEFSSDKYTGASEILYDSFIGASDFEVSLSSFEVYGGNFKLVVVHNDEIVATLEPGTFVNYRLEDITGYVSLRIAGESASFRFCMTEFDYDAHSHAE